MFKKSLFVFHRDLRVNDNTALINALKKSQKVSACFIFDSRQIKNNSYKSEKALYFMAQSLIDLQMQMKNNGGRLSLFFGLTDKVIEKIILKEKIEAVFSNFDYTPFAKKRDFEIKAVCKKYQVDFFQAHDYLLTVPDEILTLQQTPYKVFSAFFKQAQKRLPRKVIKIKFNNFSQKKLNFENDKILKKILSKNEENLIPGGREQGLKQLNKIKSLRNYKDKKDFPALSATSLLSAHLKFGTVSVREVYWKIVKEFNFSHELIRQLYWRDFFTYLADHFPFVFKGSFNKKYNKIKWRQSRQDFQKWCQGKTGFPIVDAGMRQLNKTGYMPNRVRMLAASFLIKDLHINWRWGEKYFAQKLYDYDPSLNNGNWQWVASTGADAQPYFRIFNPWLQQKKFDPNCNYIKKWIPELKSLASRDIHNWGKKQLKSKYFAPMENHQLQAKYSQSIFHQV